MKASSGCPWAGVLPRRQLQIGDQPIGGRQHIGVAEIEPGLLQRRHRLAQLRIIGTLRAQALAGAIELGLGLLQRGLGRLALGKGGIARAPRHKCPS